MTLQQQLTEFIKAGFSGLWLHSYEHNDAFNEILAVCQARVDEGKGPWYAMRWSMDQKLHGNESLMRVVRGLPCVEAARINTEQAAAPALPMTRTGRLNQGEDRASREREAARAKYVDSANQMLAMFPQLVTEMRSQLPNLNAVILVLDNFHCLLESQNGKFYVQQLLSLINDGKAGLQTEGFDEPVRYFVVILSPTTNIPVELNRHVTIVDHKLPDRDQIWNIVEQMVDKRELPQGTDKPLVIEAATGLTRMEVENAVALSLVRTVDKETKLGRVDPQIIWELKAQCLKRSGLLTLYEGKESFAQMGGIEYFREFAVKLLTLARGNENPLLVPKGLLLLGVPGSGKSQSVKCLADATGRRLLQMDVGSLLSKYVGESDQNLREALAIADAMAPCILFIDEVEKALAGVGGEGDAGVSTRLFGQLLTWLNDHTTDVFTVCTSNNISKLPPEFSRPERFDGVFFFDMPSAEERVAIWRIYLDLFGHKPGSYDENELVGLSDQWTGAEIRCCCRLAAILQTSVREQVDNIVPVASTADNVLSNLRRWADGRCLSVRQAGRYHLPASPTSEAVPVRAAGRRRVIRR